MVSPRHTNFVITVLMSLSLLVVFPFSGEASNITAVFAFGDSTVDSGNNNHVETLFKSNHRPYGQDFPDGNPTGRFSDGKLATDFLVSHLGLKRTLPAYLDPKLRTHELLTGVSFASAGTGLDDRTAGFSMALRMERELEYFEEAVEKMEGLVGDGETKRVIANALFVVSVGTNDVMYNAYGLADQKTTSVARYHDSLLHKLEAFIQKLYGAGARRLIMAGLPPVGCLPFQISARSPKPSLRGFQRACIGRLNNDSELYNSKLQKLTLRLQHRLTGSKLLYLDIYHPIIDMVNNPSKYGFDETLRGCCGTGLVEMGPLCRSVNPACVDASRYVFWDAVHPTQAAYSLIANMIRKDLLPVLWD